jgi:predicted Zn-dependent protease with MMP-like domain
MIGLVPDGPWFLLAAGSTGMDHGQMIEVEPGRFEEMVVTALDGLPEEFGQQMRNVVVTVEHGVGPPGLLGLYEGIPLTSRTSQYAGVLPDRITIYHQAICAMCHIEQEVADQVRRTSSMRSRTISALTTVGSGNSAGKTGYSAPESTPVPQ